MGTAPAKDARIAELEARRSRHGHDRHAFVSSRASSRQARSERGCADRRAAGQRTAHTVHRTHR
eukprot:1428969-Prymnesium_polylepis.1